MNEKKEDEDKEREKLEAMEVAVTEPVGLSANSPLHRLERSGPKLGEPSTPEKSSLFLSKPSQYSASPMDVKEDITEQFVQSYTGFGGMVKTTRRKRNGNKHKTTRRKRNGNKHKTTKRKHRNIKKHKTTKRKT